MVNIGEGIKVAIGTITPSAHIIDFLSLLPGHFFIKKISRGKGGVIIVEVNSYQTISKQNAKTQILSAAKSCKISIEFRN